MVSIIISKKYTEFDFSKKKGASYNLGLGSIVVRRCTNPHMFSTELHKTTPLINLTTTIEKKIKTLKLDD